MCRARKQEYNFAEQSINNTNFMFSVPGTVYFDIPIRMVFWHGAPRHGLGVLRPKVLVAKSRRLY